MTQLISNVMFQSEGYKNDKFNVDKNIKLCSSLIFHYCQNELIPITLKDIGSLKKCNCEDKTLIEKDGVCYSCIKKD